MKRIKYKFIDLFAGCGGFSYGFKYYTPDGEYFPFEFAGAIEYDKGATDTLVSALIRQGFSENRASELVICGDITLSETKAKLYEMCPRADVIIGGPPCQSFSLIGPRSGDDEKKSRFANDSRDSLFRHYIQIVEHYKPKFIVMENVKGILSKKDPEGQLIIDEIVTTLEGHNYFLRFDNQSKPYIILNAANFGVPQKRERVFLIGNTLKKYNPVPVSTHSKSGKREGTLRYVTLRDAIGDLPPLKPKITYTGKQKGTILNNDPEEKRRIDSLNINRNNGGDPVNFRYDLFDTHYKEGDLSRKNFLDFINSGKPIFLTGHIARSHQENDIKLFEAMEAGTSSKQLIITQSELLKYIKYRMDSFVDKYKKLSWDKPCWTIFAHLQKDGNRFIHPDSAQGRTITVREAARLQSFPDDYMFEASGNIRYRYIGNAVPPLLARALAEAVYSCLNAEQGTV